MVCQVSPRDEMWLPIDKPQWRHSEFWSKSCLLWGYLTVWEADLDILRGLSKDWCSLTGLDCHALWAAHSELGVIWPIKVLCCICTVATHHPKEVGYRWGQTQADSESLGKAHEEGPQTHGHHFSYTAFSPSLRLWSHPEFRVVSGQGKRSLGPSSQVCLCACRQTAPAESGQLWHQAHLWDVPEGRKWRGFLPGAGVRAVPCLSILLRRTDDKACDYKQIQGWWVMVWLHGQWFGRNIIEKLGTWKFGQEIIWTELSEWGKNVKIFLLTSEVTKRWPRWGGGLVIRWIEWLVTCRLLSPATSPLPKALNTEDMVAGTEAAMGSATRTLTHQGWLGYCHWCSPISQQQRPRLSLQHGTVC